MSVNEALEKMEEFTKEINELKAKDDALVAEAFVRGIGKGNEILDIMYEAMAKALIKRYNLTI